MHDEDQSMHGLSIHPGRESHEPNSSSQNFGYGLDASAAFLGYRGKCGVVIIKALLFC